MKKSVAVLLSLFLLLSTASAAPDLTVKTKDPAQFSVSDCYDLIGEDLFHELVTMAATNAADRSSFTFTQLLPSYFYYAPQMTALLYEYNSQNRDPFEVLFTLGDTSPTLLTLTDELVSLGYLLKSTDTLTAEVEQAIREIQLAAQMPMNGKMTAIIADVIMAGYVPKRSVTLPYITEVAERSMKKLDSASLEYLSLAQEMTEDPIPSNLTPDEVVNILYLYSRFLHEAETYFPEHVATLNIQSAIFNPASTESFNLIHNLSGLYACVFYCANYELSSSYLKY